MVGLFTGHLWDFVPYAGLCAGLGHHLLCGTSISLLAPLFGNLGFESQISAVVGIAPLVVFPTGQQPSAGGPAAEGAMLPVAQPGAATGGGSSTCDTGGGAHGRGH